MAVLFHYKEADGEATDCSNTTGGKRVSIKTLPGFGSDNIHVGFI